MKRNESCPCGSLKKYNNMAIIRVTVSEETHKIIAVQATDSTIDFDTALGDMQKYLYISGAWAIDPTYKDSSAKDYPCTAWNGGAWQPGESFFQFGEVRPIKVIMPTALTVAGGAFAGYIATITTFCTPFFLSEDETYNTIYLKRLDEVDEQALKDAHPLGVLVFKI